MENLPVDNEPTVESLVNDVIEKDNQIADLEAQLAEKDIMLEALNSARTCNNNREFDSNFDYAISQDIVDAAIAKATETTKCVKCGAKHHGEITIIGDAEWAYICQHCVESKAIGAGQVGEGITICRICGGSGRTYYGSEDGEGGTCGACKGAEQIGGE